MNKEERLQKYLSLFRSCAGWTATDLARLLDVSRQSVSAWENYDGNIEGKGVKLSKAYYLAIRQLLETAIKDDVSDNKNQKKKHILGTLLEVLVDNPERYSASDVKTIINEAELMAPAIMKKPEQRKTISKVWPILLVGCGVALSATLLTVLGSKRQI